MNFMGFCAFYTFRDYHLDHKGSYAFKTFPVVNLVDTRCYKTSMYSHKPIMEIKLETSNYIPTSPHLTYPNYAVVFLTLEENSLI